MLHRCAREIEERHGGVVPDSLDHLVALSGIGPYTARAVLAFAFERDVAVVDTNVGRVLARLSGEAMNARDVQACADSLVRPGSGWAWNQALLDFGAACCTKRGPSCEVCPLFEWCTWQGLGPDPAVGSAAVSTGQSPFIGSDRQGRGRLVAALREGPVSQSQAHEVMGWHGDRARTARVVEGLIADGLVERRGDDLGLLDR